VHHFLEPVNYSREMESGHNKKEQEAHTDMLQYPSRAAEILTYSHTTAAYYLLTRQQSRAPALKWNNTSLLMTYRPVPLTLLQLQMSQGVPAITL